MRRGLFLLPLIAVSVGRSLLSQRVWAVLPLIASEDSGQHQHSAMILNILLSVFDGVAVWGIVSSSMNDVPPVLLWAALIVSLLALPSALASAYSNLHFRARLAIAGGLAASTLGFAGRAAYYGGDMALLTAINPILCLIGTWVHDAYSPTSVVDRSSASLSHTFYNPLWALTDRNPTSTSSSLTQRRRQNTSAPVTTYVPLRSQGSFTANYI